MVAERRLERMTVDEWRALERASHDVKHEYQRVEVYRRTETGWDSFHIYGPADELELRSIDTHFPVAAIYRRTEVPEAPPD